MGDNKTWETLAAGKQQKKQIYYLKRRRVVAKATRRLKRGLYILKSWEEEVLLIFVWFNDTSLL